MENSHGLLKGKKGIIFGALDNNSIAWKAAERIHEEGGQFILTNIPIAVRFGQLENLAKKCNAKIIGADATSISDLEHLVQQSQETFGGKIDFILHSPAMSKNIRKNKPYDDLNYDWFNNTLDVSAISFHKLMHVINKLNAINEWGSIIAISYIAAQRSFPGYLDMAEAKALLESIARSFGLLLAKKKVRVNTISQSPTKTTAASGIDMFNIFYDYADKMSPLGNATHEDFANFAVMMFSDYTRKITMQNLMNDGGFSSCGISEKFINFFEHKKELEIK